MSTQVKICGIRSEAGVDAALEGGAAYIGFVFHPDSPRYIDLAQAAKLARRVHANSNAKVVALLVDALDEDIAVIVNAVRPDIVQLHGRECPERTALIAKDTGLPIWKALPVATGKDVDAAAAYMVPGGAERILYDAKPPAQAGALPGGNGLTFNWHILADRKGQPFVLAGGLNADNVAQAIELLAPGVVDVSSGVETSPGEKSPELIRRFLRAAKAASPLTSPRP